MISRRGRSLELRVRKAAQDVVGSADVVQVHKEIAVGNDHQNADQALL